MQGKYVFIFTGVTIKIGPEIIEPPQATAGRLYSPASLTCRAIGSPTPSIHWYKNNKLIANNNPDLSVLVFTELTLNDRGFYHCEARNIIDGKNLSVNSSNILLNITSKNMNRSEIFLFALIFKDVLQYEVEMILPLNFYSGGLNGSQPVDNVIKLMIDSNNYLSGSNISNASFLFMEILNIDQLK